MYGLMIALGVLSTLLLAEKNSARFGLDKTAFWKLAFITLIFGIIGARVYHILDFWPFYLENPLRGIAIWEGGLSILGAIIGGTAALILCTKKGERLAWFDLGAGVLPLAQAIGRLGNFFNQEVFGIPTNLPWGVFIDENKRPLEYKEYALFHPLFLYEALLNLLLFFILNKIPKGKPKGWIFYTYLVGYGIIRFATELLRGNMWEMTAAYSGEIISMGFILFGGINILKLTHAQNNSRV